MSDLSFLHPDTASAEAELPWLMTRDEGELAVDVYETESAIFVKTAIAGVKPEDIKLSLSADMLTIRGARHDDIAQEDDGRRYLSQECHWGAFSRTIILPGEINAQKAEASFKSGLLLIKLPKAKRDANIKVTVEEE